MQKLKLIQYTHRVEDGYKILLKQFNNILKFVRNCAFSLSSIDFSILIANDTFVFKHNVATTFISDNNFDKQIPVGLPYVALKSIDKTIEREEYIV